jgi:hypothetical protein
MTVCIASVAERGGAIVLIADRMVSLGNVTGEGITTKLLRVGDSPWSALVSGYLSLAERIIQETGAKIADKPTIAESFLEMMDCVKAACQTVYDQRLEDEVYHPRGLTPALVVQRPSDLLPLDPLLLWQIELERKQFQNDAFVSMLVCGFEQSQPRRPHIFTVETPGVCESQDTDGFAAIGIGAEVAISRLYAHEHGPDEDLVAVLYHLFDAKAWAEISPGVGYESQIWLMLPGRPEPVPVQKDIVTLLSDVFDAHPSTPLARRDHWPPRKAMRRGWERQVGDYLDGIATT